MERPSEGYIGLWGFTPQKSVRCAFEKNLEEVCCCWTRNISLIQKQVKREKAGVYRDEKICIRPDHARRTCFAIKENLLAVIPRRLLRGSSFKGG